MSDPSCVEPVQFAEIVQHLLLQVVRNVAVLTPKGYRAVAETAPGHVEQVRRILFDRLTPEQVGQLRVICEAVLAPEAGPGSGPGGSPEGSPSDGERSNGSRLA